MSLILASLPLRWSLSKATEWVGGGTLTLVTTYVFVVPAPSFLALV